MNNITTLEKVFNRVDELSQNCFDQNVNVNDLSFDNLDSISIAGESTSLKNYRPEIHHLAPGYSLSIFEKVPAGDSIRKSKLLDRT